MAAYRSKKGAFYFHGSSNVDKLYCDDYAALFVSLVDVPVRVNHLFQGIGPINDRFYLIRLNKLFEEN